MQRPPSPSTPQGFFAFLLEPRVVRTVLVIASVLLLAWEPGAHAAGGAPCLTGNGPDVANDRSQILAVRAGIDSACACASFDGTKGKSKSNYVKCAARIIATQVDAKALRPECERTVKKYYAASTCGRNPKLHAVPCVQRSVPGGRITCTIRATTRLDGVTPAAQCTSKARSVRMACAGYTHCIDAADSNGDLVVAAPSDDGMCAPTVPPTPTPTTTWTPTKTPLVETTLVVTDDATTIPGGPPPVVYGGTIQFTATVGSASGTPEGVIQWSLSHGACVDTPVVGGVATCAVTPPATHFDRNGYEGTFLGPVTATATFVPAAGSPYGWKTASDSTVKTTASGFFPEPQVPFVVISVVPGDTLPITVQGATDSLGRNIIFLWRDPIATWLWGLPEEVITTTPVYAWRPSPGLSTLTLDAVCPEGVDPSVSFECNRLNLSILTKNEYQVVAAVP